MQTKTIAPVDVEQLDPVARENLETLDMVNRAIQGLRSKTFVLETIARDFERDLHNPAGPDLLYALHPDFFEDCPRPPVRRHLSVAELLRALRDDKPIPPRLRDDAELAEAELDADRIRTNLAATFADQAATEPAPADGDDPVWIVAPNLVQHAGRQHLPTCPEPTGGPCGCEAPRRVDVLALHDL
jgi:hypothetical protein